MVGDNYTDVQRRLDEIRITGHKFICLNDDMNKTHDPDPRLLKALRDFYLSYFPTPSPFELPPGQINEFLHLDDLLASRSRLFHVFPFYRFSFINWLLITIFFILLCILPSYWHSFTRILSSKKRRRSKEIMRKNMLNFVNSLSYLWRDSESKSCFNFFLKADRCIKRLSLSPQIELQTISSVSAN